MTTTDLCMLSATELVARYRARELSPIEVTTAVLERMDRVGPTVNAFCQRDDEAALAAARASEARWSRGEPAGLADGVPTSVKDLIVAKGWPTLRGSQAVDADQAWDEDGPPVARLREQGAVILGKTCTPEFGWKGVTDSPLTGVTGNPWNPALTPGGSSGGAAAACGLGMGALHVATDGAGSIRIPAGFSGLFGLKPTFGLVPVHPHGPAGTLWHQGPISRSVADAALMLTVISGTDARDLQAVPSPGIDYREFLNGGIAGLRIGFCPDLGGAQVADDVAARVAEAAENFGDLGAEVEQVETPFDDPLETLITIWSVGLAWSVAAMSEAQKAVLEAPLRSLAEQGAKVSAVAYRQAEAARQALAQTMRRFHEQYDLLLSPQLPLTAFAVGHEVPPDSGMTRWWEWSPFTYPFNLTQQPAACLPCGFGDDGMPVAAQLVAARFGEGTLLRTAAAYEAAHPFTLPPLPAG